MRYPGAGDVMKLADSSFAVRDAVLAPRETARNPLAASSAAQPLQVRRLVVILSIIVVLFHSAAKRRAPVKVTDLCPD
jgi:hypothetical protein